MLGRKTKTQRALGPPGTTIELLQRESPMDPILYHLYAIMSEAMQHVETTLSWSANKVSSVSFLIRERSPTSISNPDPAEGILPLPLPFLVPVPTHQLPLFIPQLLQVLAHSLIATAMNGPLHDPHAHKRTDINQLLNPVTPSSAIEHGLPHPPSSYANGHYPPNATYTHPPMPPPPHQRVANGTYKLNPASWGDGTDHDRQRLDNMPLQRGYAPGAVPYPDFHSHVPRTHEDGLSDPSVSVWPSPSGRLEAGYGSPSYSDERTSMYLL